MDTVHECDIQTDGQMDGIGMAYTRYSIYMYAVARKKNITGKAEARTNYRLGGLMTST